MLYEVITNAYNKDVVVKVTLDSDIASELSVSTIKLYYKEIDSESEGEFWIPELETGLKSITGKKSGTNTWTFTFDSSNKLTNGKILSIVFEIRNNFV